MKEIFNKSSTCYDEKMFINLYEQLNSTNTQIPLGDTCSWDHFAHDAFWCEHKFSDEQLIDGPINFSVK